MHFCSRSSPIILPYPEHEAGAVLRKESAVRGSEGQGSISRHAFSTEKGVCQF